MNSRRIIAVFDSQAMAQNARDHLLELGLAREEVNIVDQSSSEFETTNEEGQGAGFWAHFKEIFMPDDDRATLDESLRRGGFVLVATVVDEHADEVIATLESDGAVDLEQRQSEWHTAGGEAAQATPPQPSKPVSAEGHAGEQTIPVAEERLRVGKREVNRGSVKVRSFIVEEPVQEEVRLREERVEVERRPVEQSTRPVAKGSPADLLEERTIELTETAEEAVVSKDAVVTGEVHVRKTAADRVEQVNDTVRRTEVEVDDTRTSAPKAPPPSDASRPPRV